MSRFLLSAEAQEDLEDIRRYMIEQGGPRLSIHVRGEIMKQIRFLAGTPGAGHLREDLTLLPLRFWSVFSYLIIYDPAAAPIKIVRIMHGARDIEATLERG